MTAEPPSATSQDEKQPPSHQTELVRHPTIAFDDQGANQPEIEEGPAHPHTHVLPRSGNKILEMRRELTQEEKELSRANYDHLERQKSHHGEKDAGDGEEEDDANQADIREHKYTIEQLQDAFKTDFDVKQPSSSFGLTGEEAAARLIRDGPNVLTPPKKKSAFQKVNPNIPFTLSSSTRTDHSLFLYQYIDCLRSLFNVLLILAGILEYILLGVDYQVRIPAVILSTVDLSYLPSDLHRPIKPTHILVVGHLSLAWISRSSS